MEGLKKEKKLFNELQRKENEKCNRVVLTKSFNTEVKVKISTKHNIKYPSSFW